MSGEPCGTAHLLLQAELDGELDAAGSAGLASHLTGCKACLNLRDDLGRLSMRLRDIPRHAVPPGLHDTVAAMVPRRRASWRGDWTHAGAFGAGLAVAASVMALVLPEAERNAGSDLVSAHLRALQPGHLIDMPSSDRHAVKPWFNGRIGISPIVPDLAGQGFPLLGGRIDYVGRRPAAVLVYARRQHVIDVFVQGDTVTAAARPSDGYNVTDWTLEGLSYRAVSDLNMDELGQFTALMKTSGRDQAVPR